VLSDFNFCLRVCKSNAAICFHDDVVIAPAIERIVKLLQRERIPFKAVKLEGDTFGILLRDSPAIDDPFVRSHGVDGMRWLKKRSFRRTVQGLVPQPLRPAGSWIADRLGCRTVR
jgi:hypothetical protein